MWGHVSNRVRARCFGQVTFFLGLHESCLLRCVCVCVRVCVKTQRSKDTDLCQDFGRAEMFCLYTLLYLGYHLFCFESSGWTCAMYSQ